MPFKVLTAEFLHESNTFSTRKTTLRTFQNDCLHDGAAALRIFRGTNSGAAGMIDAQEAYGWSQVHVVSAHAGPGGPVTAETFDTISARIVEAARRERPDGILLALHGAMVTEEQEDGEGELLERLRAAVGPEVPIAITLDLHANVTRRMCALAQIIVSYKTYPHIDLREAAAHAGAILDRAMRGEIRPQTLRAWRPMLEEVNGGRTDIGPMQQRLEQARTYEQTPDVFAVSINAGFASADMSEVGPTVLVTCQGDLLAHQAFAEAIADDIWDRRRESLNTYFTVEQAAAQAVDWGNPGRPLIIADYADNPGAGAYGDAPALLEALLAAGVDNAAFGPIVDPQAAATLHRTAVGSTVTIALGGKEDPRFGGGPLTVTGTLRLLADGKCVGDGPMMGGIPMDFGPTAVIRVNGVDVLVVTESIQMFDQQLFRAFGIDPTAKQVVALKSMQHFRAAFEPIAGKVIVCDSGALCTVDYTRLPYVRVPRPLYPLDPDLELAPSGAVHPEGVS